MPLLPSWCIHIGRSCGASRAAFTAAFTVPIPESEGMIGLGGDLGAPVSEGPWRDSRGGFGSFRTKCRSWSSGGLEGALGDMAAIVPDMEGMTTAAERGDGLRVERELSGGELGSAML